MKNKYLKILLKKKEDRTALELLDAAEFYVQATPQEFRYALKLEAAVTK